MEQNREVASTPSWIHLLIQQIFIECLHVLETRHHLMHWGSHAEQDKYAQKDNLGRKAKPKSNK